MNTNRINNFPCMTEEEFIKTINNNKALIDRVCMMFCSDSEDRKDLSQDIMYNAWRSNGSFRGEAKFSTWLYQLALNTACTWHRKKPNNKNSALLQSTYLPDQDLKMLAVVQLLKELSKVEKAILILVFEGYKYHEIANFLGTTSNNVAVKINRLRKKIISLPTLS